MTLCADVDVQLDGFHEDVHLDVADGEVVAVLGPNGAGKTTLLRALAGVLPISGGRIVLDGQVLDDPAQGVLVPPEGRSCGLVFQEHLLFPHLDALANVAFGPRRRGASKSEALALSRDWLERLDVADVAHQRPRSLSGGQSQRVALARALATGPRLLLLDEPMAALDVTRRSAIRRLLRDHVARSGTSCVLVTHDPLDATALADTVVVVDAGRVVQHGSPADLARRPASSWVARLLGVNLVQGQVRDGWFDLGAGLAVPVADGSDGARWGVVAPRAVTVAPYGLDAGSGGGHGDATRGGHGDTSGGGQGGRSRTSWSTRVVDVQPTGDRVVLELGYPSGLTADVPARRPDAGLWVEGMPVQVSIDPSDLDLFAPPPG